MQSLTNVKMANARDKSHRRQPGLLSGKIGMKNSCQKPLMIHRRAVPDQQRPPEDALWGAFEKACPRILGALLDAVSAALWHIPHVESTGRHHARPTCQMGYCCQARAGTTTTFLSMRRVRNQHLMPKALPSRSGALL